MIDIACLCATPGPLGLVDGGRRGAGGALLLVGVVVVVQSCGRWWWWRASVGNGAIGIACLCATPGPFNLVDRGGGVCLVCSDHRHRPLGARRRRWWVAAQSIHAVSITRFCATRGLSLDAGGQ